MRIGELARRAGVSTRALRHYEALGLVTAGRTANGYRDYAGPELRAVAEIRSLAGLGFTLEETRPFVECLRAGSPVGGACPDSIAVYRRKLGEVDEYLARLSQVRDELQAQLARALGARAHSAGDPRCEFSRPGSLP
jgi:DNA-binding transcriptional MerR regulator